MKFIRSLFIALSLAFVSAPIMAETSNSPEKSRPIKLLQKDRISGPMRCPAQPLFGYYINEILFVDLSAIDCNASVTLRVYTADTTILSEYSCESSQLTIGVSLSLGDEDRIALVLPNGVVYTEVSDYGT